VPSSQTLYSDQIIYNVGLVYKPINPGKETHVQSL